MAEAIMNMLRRDLTDDNGAIIIDQRNKNMHLYLAQSLNPSKDPQIRIGLNNLMYEVELKYVLGRALVESEYLKENSEDYTVAFIWDLDDITKLSSERLFEISQHQPDVNSMSLHRLVDRILMSVDIAHPNEVAAQDVMNIEDALYDQPFSPKYYALKKLYNDIAQEDNEYISHALLEKCGMVGEEVELCQTSMKFQNLVNQRWKNVRKSLDLVNRISKESRDNNFVNVVISKEGVVYAVSQLLVAGYASSIAVENVYATCDNMEYAWQKMRTRLGEQCRLVYITSSMVPTLPANMGIQVCPINVDERIENIYNVQELLLK